MIILHLVKAPVKKMIKKKLNKKKKRKNTIKMLKRKLINIIKNTKVIFLLNKIKT